MLEGSLTMCMAFALTPERAIRLSRRDAVSQTEITNGSLVGLNLRSSQPSLHVLTASGESVQLALDPKVSRVFRKGGEVMKFTQLQAGQHVEVCSLLERRKPVVRDIKVMEKDPASGCPSNESRQREESHEY